MKNNLEQKMNEIAELIAQSNRVLIFTGAGISTESGIPDFRSPGGVWTKYDPEYFTIQKFLSDKESREKIWSMLTESGLMMTEAKPNPGHYAIAELEKMNKLYGIVTQNVDGLHQKAGVSDDLVFQLHGDMSHAKCLSCGKRYSMDEMIEWLNRGIKAPECGSCSGILKPDGVFFGEQLPIDVLREAEHRSRNCEICIVLGSSLVVYPAASLPMYALKSKAKLIIINIGSTSMDNMATVHIEGKSGEVMPKIIDKVKKKISPS